MAAIQIIIIRTIIAVEIFHHYTVTDDQKKILIMQSLKRDVRFVTQQIITIIVFIAYYVLMSVICEQSRIAPETTTVQ